MNEQNKRLSREEWRSHFKAWQDSGESQLAYCQRHNLKHSTFCYWRKQLKQNSEQSKAGFETLSVQTSHQLLPDIRIHLPNGIQLSISTSAGMSLLRDVLGLLGVVSC